MPAVAAQSITASSLVGREIAALPTPSLVVDLPALQFNLKAMQAKVKHFGKALRPHIKTHKCSRLARLQVEGGAVGVTCATVGEAEAMAAGGITDILIANQVVTPDKLERLARLAQICELKFVVDSLQGIQAAEATARENSLIFEVLVEVDTGGRRCGAQSPHEALTLVRRVLDSPHLRFGGLQAYFGGTSYIPDLAERQRRVAESDQRLGEVLEALYSTCAFPRVSGAGTGNALMHLQNGLLTEIQAGSYVYSDTTYRDLAPAFRPALYVLSAVISRPTGARVVMDAGLKSMGSEFGSPLVVDYPHLRDPNFSEEHLQWEAGQGAAPRIGEKLLVMPSHCCTTVNLHRRCFLIKAGLVVDEWAIDAF